MSRVIVLMYHIIDEPQAAIEGKYCCPPGRFDEQMCWLRASGRRLLSLDELADCIDRRVPVEDGSVAVTFDDGFDEPLHLRGEVVRRRAEAQLLRRQRQVDLVVHEDEGSAHATRRATSTTYICRLPSCTESMQTWRPSRLQRGCRSQRISPPSSGGA